jgi:O-antigen/teichoic acid export membrane protein
MDKEVSGLDSVTVSKKTNSSVFELLLSKLLRAPLWLMISAVIARLLGPEGVGIWSMTLAAGMLLNQFFFHWSQAITQQYGRTEFLQKGHLNEVMVLRLVLLLSGMALCVLTWLFLDVWFKKLFGVSPDTKVYLALLAFWLMAETQSLQQVQERFVHLAWSPIVADLLLLAGLGLVALNVLEPSGDSLNGKLIFFLSLMCVTWLVFLVIELRSVQFQLCLPSFKLLPGMIYFAAPLIPGFLIAYFSEWSDYFLIRHFLDEFSVGLYHPAFQFLLILVGLPTALASVLLPKFVALFQKEPEQALNTLLLNYAPLFNMAWCALLLIPISILPMVFLLLLGDKFSLSGPLLTILLAAAPGAMTQHVFGISYFLRRKLLLSTFVFFSLKLCVNVAVTVFLINHVGLVAAAIGGAFSYCILQWLFVYFAWPGELPSRSAVLTLLWCQLCGLTLALIHELEWRIVVAIFLLLCTVIFMRIFSMLNLKLLMTLMPSWLVKAGTSER